MNRNGIVAAVCSIVLSAAAGYSQLPLEYYFPAASPQGRIIRHTAFTLQYNERFRQADWVIYLLTAARVSGQISATPDYRTDPELGTSSVQSDDYQGSGYERGQLVPADDMRWSKTAHAESYYMSVVSPMKTVFRKGLWAELEAQTRNWAVENAELYVVTGPVLKGDLPPAGRSGILSPQYFYRVLLVAREQGMKGIGFILPAAGSKKSLMLYAVPIDSVESVTGIDFFSNLPDRTERAIEASLDPTLWVTNTAGQDSTGRAVTVPVPVQRKLTGKAFTPAVLCKGITKDGKRCVRMTTNPNGYCWEHQDQAKPSSKP
jgi:endonuclease G